MGRKTIPGPRAREVMDVLSRHALRGEKAPSQQQIGAEIGLCSSSVQREIEALVATGGLEMRADPLHIYQRSYRIVESGLETAGFLQGVSVDAVKRPPVADSFLQIIASTAAKGAFAPSLPDIAVKVNAAHSTVQTAMCRLCAEGKIEVRAIGSKGGRRRAYRIKATGAETAGFADAFPIDVPLPQSRGGGDLGRPRHGGRVVKRTQRPCITCQTEFWSEGPHHRMCSSCRGTNVQTGTYRVMTP